MTIIGEWRIVPEERRAELIDDEDITCCVSNGLLCVDDGTQYYPGGCYRIPLELIDRLREMPR